MHHDNSPCDTGTLLREFLTCRNISCDFSLFSRWKNLLKWSHFGTLENIHINVTGQLKTLNSFPALIWRYYEPSLAQYYIPMELILKETNMKVSRLINKCFGLFSNWFYILCLRYTYRKGQVKVERCGLGFLKLCHVKRVRHREFYKIHWLNIFVQMDTRNQWHILCNFIVLLKINLKWNGTCGNKLQRCCFQ